MAATSTWTTAGQAALHAWAAHVDQAGWHLPAAATAFAAVALASAQVPRPMLQPAGSMRGWPVATLVLVLLALNTLLAPDVLALQLLRGIARAQGWYEHRHQAQVAAMAAATACGLGVAMGCRRLGGASGPVEHGMPLGVAVLLMVAAARSVSLHATDALINSRPAGMSCGRLAECAGLCLVALATRQARQARPTGRRTNP